MAYEILSESYGRRLPKIAAEADSADDLATLGTNWAEGSTCAISTTTYKLDKVKGWIDPSSGGSGGGALMVNATYSSDTEMMTLDKTCGEISAAIMSGQMCFVHVQESVGTIYAGYNAVTCLLIDQYGGGTVGMLNNENGTPQYINFDANAADEYPSKYLGD